MQSTPRLKKNLCIGGREFSHSFVQAPLAGVSCAPFRQLATQHGAHAYTCTEMISCKTLLYSAKIQDRFTRIAKAEGPVCFQLASDSPRELGEAVKRVTDFGASLIDLNCGCPVKKIRSKGYGSKLLANSQRLFDLITAMKNNTHLPVSVKIRVDGGSQDLFNESVAKAIEDAGADALCVHGRHWTEHYETPCQHEQIKWFVERMSIPVIGNGDVACLDSLNAMLATGCDAVMIGRAGVGQPWLSRALLAAHASTNYRTPTLKARAELFLNHIEGLAELLTESRFALLQARMLAKYYARGTSWRDAFCQQINACQSMQALQATTLRFFEAT